VTVRVRLVPGPTGTLHIGTAEPLFSTGCSPPITAVLSCCGSEDTDKGTLQALEITRQHPRWPLLARAWAAGRRAG